MSVQNTSKHLINYFLRPKPLKKANKIFHEKKNIILYIVAVCIYDDNDFLILLQTNIKGKKKHRVVECEKKSFEL